MTAALEAEPSLSNAGAVLSSPRPEGSKELVKMAHRKSRASDYSSGGGARSFSDSPLTHPLPEAPPHKPHPSAAGQSEQEERLETTPINEVHTPRRQRPSLTSTDEGEEPQEGAEQAAPLRSLLSDRSVAPHRISKRERNRLKSQRRKERRRERWIQNRLYLHKQVRELQ